MGTEAQQQGAQPLLAGHCHAHDDCRAFVVLLAAPDIARPPSGPAVRVAAAPTAGRCRRTTDHRSVGRSAPHRGGGGSIAPGAIPVLEAVDAERPRARRSACRRRSRTSGRDRAKIDRGVISRSVASSRLADQYATAQPGAVGRPPRPASASPVAGARRRPRRRRRARRRACRVPGPARRRGRRRAAASRRGPAISRAKPSGAVSRSGLVNSRGTPAYTMPSSMNTSIISSMNGGRPHSAASSRSPISSASVSSNARGHLGHRHLAALHQPRQHHQQSAQPLAGTAGPATASVTSAPPPSSAASRATRRGPRRRRAPRRALPSPSTHERNASRLAHGTSTSTPPSADAGRRSPPRRARRRRTWPACRRCSTATVGDHGPSSFGSAGKTCAGSKLGRPLELARRSPGSTAPSIRSTR